MVTRRVHQRQLLLVNDADIAQVILYTLAYCMSKYDIALHAIITEGNHIHQQNTDPKGRRPDFLRDFHSFTARQINKRRKMHDAFFSNKQTSIVESQMPEDTTRRIAYLMANPVADGIEREGKNHKGIRMRWPQPDMVIARPKGFWRPMEKGGVAPDEVTLRFSRPPGYEDLSDTELDALLEEQVLASENAAREEREAQSKGFRCDVTNRLPDPHSFPSSPHTAFALSPLIGAFDRAHRLAAILRLRKFRSDYKEARDRVLAGEEGVVFPYGTFFVVQRWGMAVAPAPN